MTSNQISYAKLLEDKRANLAREAENVRANTLNYNASVYSTQAHMWAADRSALATENAAALNYNARMRELAETSQHNRAQEEETLRHNAAVEVINSREADTRRAQQKEASRHNEASERLGAWSNIASFAGSVINSAAGLAKGLLVPVPIK